MDEALRSHLKIRRDTVERGHSLVDVKESIARRRADYDRFLLPQRDHADVVFVILPVSPDWQGNPAWKAAPPLKLKVLLRHAIDYDPLARALIVYCGANVDVIPADRDNPTTLVIDGADIGVDDIAFLASQLVPELDELLTLRPVWQAGTAGVMQLVVLLELAQKRTTRLDRPSS